MKQITKCASGLCPRILEDAAGDYVAIGPRLKLEEQIGLNLDTDERGVRIPRDVMLEAARAIIREQMAEDCFAT
jgi:hypothetical protein